MTHVQNVCPICKRALGSVVNEHHFIPKSLGGKETTTLHIICHSKIHRTFTERELFNYYNTPKRVLENGDIQKFIKWISKKPIDYRDKNKDTKDRKRKRGR